MGLSFGRGAFLFYREARPSPSVKRALERFRERIAASGLAATELVETCGMRLPDKGWTETKIDELENCEAVKAPATPLRAQQRWSSKADTCLRKPPDTTRVEKNATRHVAAT